MSSVARRWIAVGALLAALGVGLGAFGAHGLREALTHQGYSGEDLSRRLAIWETAIRYQMFHAIAIVLAGFALQQRDTRAWRLAPWFFLVGIILFSGLLKVLTFAGPQWNWLGAIVPIGGVSMIAGWLTFAICAITCSKEKSPAPQ
jgi:uncharacterized membrane protein YgdD (TMEM256/DUF423 family)